MPAIRPISQIANKWKDRTGTAGPQYSEGVQQPKKDWAANASAGANNWQAGVTAAAADDRFKKGVAAAGNAKWQKGAVMKGTQRFASGVQMAEPEFQAGFEKYANVIASTKLPPRFAKGDPRNVDRVRDMSSALRRAKTGKG